MGRWNERSYEHGRMCRPRYRRDEYGNINGWWFGTVLSRKGSNLWFSFPLGYAPHWQAYRTQRKRCYGRTRVGR